MRDSARGRRTAVLGVAVLLAVAGLFAGQFPARADDPVKLLLLLDVSGSMNEKISSGGTKLAAAKSALKRVADSVPAGTQVGLRVYGSKIKEPKEENPKACRDTELVMPIGPLDRGRLYGAVDSFDAVGETPIAYSLEQSVEDLGPDGRRVVVLISDGEENCVKDPCPVAKKLAGAGVQLQFNAIGLDVNSKARKQLQCIVDVTDGSYYDADDTDELNESLDKLTKRALRPFSVSGRPVRGAADEASAPALGAGQYVDRYEAAEGPRHYRIDRTPGSTVSAALSTIVSPYRGGMNQELWDLTLTTFDGGSCDVDNSAGAVYFGTSVRSLSVTTARRDPGSARDDPCVTDPLLLTVERKSPVGNNASVAVELAIREDPPITNLAELPAGLQQWPEPDPVAAGRAEPVVGGTAFSNAPALTAGSFSDTITAGETLFYRVPLQPGQALRLTVDAPRGGTTWTVNGIAGVTPSVRVLSPVRATVAETSKVLVGSRRGPVRLTTGTPQVRIRNREVTPHPRTEAISQTFLGGDYFIAVGLNPGSTAVSGIPMRIQLNLAIDGKPAGLPVHASPTPTVAPTAPPSPTDSASASPGPGDPPPSSEPVDQGGDGPPDVGVAVAVVAGIVGALVVAGAVVVLWLRHRRRRG